ncbi:MAG: FHA domain-containing protein, partial [Deltaproteobacteria bacterium]|nr:FHA domain-containing protein [Deltaproteobacteria bacterium]
MGQADILHLRTIPLSRRETFTLGNQPRVALLVYHRRGVEMTPLVEAHPIVVGREAPADVLIDSHGLSHQHARFELKEGRVWVEDLGSTNGTLVNGEKVERVELEPGAEVNLGGVLVSVNTLAPAEEEPTGLLNHERFVDRLTDELERHRTFHRSCALVLLREPGGEHLRHWWPSLRKMLRT